MMNLSRSLTEIKKISHRIGKDAYFVQGGGGNTSVKLNGSEMLVKASGFRLRHAAERQGFVIVNYANIKNYYSRTKAGARDAEKTSMDFVLKHTKNLKANLRLRPSIETGFHSFLGKYVIHTHSVYVNIVACSKNGRVLARRIFSDYPERVLWIPYSNPGFYLTRRIMQEVRRYRRKFKDLPRVIFLQNHGLIVSADSARECVRLHEEVNRRVRAYLKIREAYPKIKLASRGPAFHRSRTAYVRTMVKNGEIGPEFFKTVLFPDQVVYLGDALSYGDAKRASLVHIDRASGNVLYRTSFLEALTIEETMVAYCYIRNLMDILRLSPAGIERRHARYIHAMESEKYRSQLLK